MSLRSVQVSPGVTIARGFRSPGSELHCEPEARAPTAAQIPPFFPARRRMTNRRPRSRTLASTLAAVALLSGALYAASGSASAAPAHPAGAARTSSPGASATTGRVVRVAAMKLTSDCNGALPTKLPVSGSVLRSDVQPKPAPMYRGQSVTSYEKKFQSVAQRFTAVTQ